MFADAFLFVTGLTKWLMIGRRYLLRRWEYEGVEKIDKVFFKRRTNVMD